jgi:WD40 repeat protein
MTASASNQLATFSPDGGSIAMTSSFGAKLCQYPSGSRIAEFDGPGKYVSAMAFSSDGKTVAVASDDGKLLFFDTAARRASGTLDAHEDYISGVAFSRDGRSLVTGSADKTVKLWDAASHGARVTWKGHAGSVDAIAISPDGRTIASVGDDKTVRLWEVSGRAEYEELTGLDILLTSISVSPKDDRVAFATASTINIWDPAARKFTASLAEHSEGISEVAFSPDQRTIAIASKTTELWDSVSGKNEPLPGNVGRTYAVAWSPDGKTLAAGGADGSVRLWNAESRQALPVAMKGHAKGVATISFAPDGTVLASGSDDRTVKLWDVASGRELASAALSLAAPESPDDHPVTSVQFSPGGQMLAASATDGTVTLWRAGARRLERLATLTGHTAAVNRVAFSPDGRTIATASADTTVKLWNAALFRELVTLREPKRKRDDLPEFLRGSENQVSALAFSRDSKSLMTGLNDGTVRIRVAAR